MRSSTRTWFALAFGVFCLCFVASVAAIAAYYDEANGIGYETAIGLNVVWLGLRSSSYALSRAITLREWVLLACVASGLLVFLLTSNKQKSPVRCAVFAAHLFVVPWGWLGLLALVYTMFLGVDGEWLGEHFPTLIVAGLWLLYALAMVIASWDRSWLRRRSDRALPQSGPA